MFLIFFPPYNAFCGQSIFSWSKVKCSLEHRSNNVLFSSSCIIFLEFLPSNPIIQLLPSHHAAVSRSGGVYAQDLEVKIRSFLNVQVFFEFRFHFMNFSFILCVWFFTHNYAHNSKLSCIALSALFMLQVPFGLFIKSAVVILNMDTILQ